MIVILLPSLVIAAYISDSCDSSAVVVIVASKLSTSTASRGIVNVVSSSITYESSHPICNSSSTGVTLIVTVAIKALSQSYH